MSTANKLTYLNDTKTLLKQKINNLGGDITDSTTFRQYADKLQTIYDNAPKTDYAEGSNITLSNCLKGKLDYEDDKVGYGDTSQAIIPSEYQQVEYIESTGPAYIDTGFIPNTNTKIDIQFETIQKGTNGIIFGGEEAFGTNAFHLYATYNDFDIGFGNRYTATQIAYDLNTKYTFVMDKNGVNINGTTGTFTSNTISTTNSIYLFALHRASTAIDSDAQKRIYYCKLYDNGTLVRNMIPCYRISDNVIGMYDLVNDTFYTNIGTGTFTKGNNVPTPTTPIPIKTVTGEQTVTVRGINLLPNILTAQTISGVTITVNKDKTVTLNGTSTAQIELDIGNTENLKVGTYIGNCGDNSSTTTYYIRLGKEAGASGTWLENVTKNTTITLNENTNVYARLIIRNNVTLNSVTIYPQIIEGSTALPYEPYITPITKQLSLGNLEFAEIGDYRDYILTDRSTKKWYVKKNIEHKKASDITENDIGTGGQGLYFTPSFTNVIANRTLQVYSNTQTWKNATDTDWNTLNGSYIGVLYNVQQIYINKSGTKSELITWLNSINFEMYYILATPTDTEITDTTLINQLEDIYNIMSLNGTTIVEIAGELPMIMKVRALKNG